LGDKDTFGFAFAAARKLHQLHAVPLPPGVALRYELSGQPWQQQGKWHFNCMMQYDHLVSATAYPAGCDVHRGMWLWSLVCYSQQLFPGECEAHVKMHYTRVCVPVVVFRFLTKVRFSQCKTVEVPCKCTSK
jgi:hypothetical protein